nr:protein n-methyltransferase nnt1 [Quercus suber]
MEHLMPKSSEGCPEHLECSEKPVDIRPLRRFRERRWRQTLRAFVTKHFILRELPALVWRLAMSALTDLIRIVSTDVEDEPEDIFAYTPGLIFTDDLRNIHGDPSSTIVYLSGKYGEIALRTADPETENERKLFSHYLWNAGIKMAELVSGDDETWTVKNETVLELGAGGREVTISDYPAPVVLKNIAQNAASAIPTGLQTNYRVEGHEWGAFDTPFAKQNEHHFTRIIAADCYWMPDQHLNLVRSMGYFLTLESEARVFVVAGFHTGRTKLAAFFDVAVQEGFDIELIYEEDADGVRRPWVRDRDGGAEDHTGRNKWLIIARLCRSSQKRRGTDNPWYPALVEAGHLDEQLKHNYHVIGIQCVHLQLLGVDGRCQGARTPSLPYLLYCLSVYLTGQYPFCHDLSLTSHPTSLSSQSEFHPAILMDASSWSAPCAV